MELASGSYAENGKEQQRIHSRFTREDARKGRAIWKRNTKAGNWTKHATARKAIILREISL